jgi:hypothetical protein
VGSFNLATAALSAQDWVMHFEPRARLAAKPFSRSAKQLKSQ